MVVNDAVIIVFVIAYTSHDENKGRTSKNEEELEVNEEREGRTQRMNITGATRIYEIAISATAFIALGAIYLATRARKLPNPFPYSLGFPFH